MIPGVDVLGPVSPALTSILAPDALAFVAALARGFTARRDALLLRRREQQARFDAGEPLAFLPETADLRADDWTVAKLPADLLDRRVEITGPVDRKMVINALNSGADVFMADFEDATAPTWANMIEGQAALRDAVRRQIDFEHPETGKRYRLGADPATLMVRPRGWHLDERHLRVDGRPVPGALFDFGLFFFHNARALVERGSGPYFYLPKLQSHHEARLWDDVFRAAQRAVGLPVGTIKATVLIETLPAAFEMDEILYALREHSAGLNCGRWDYIFSYIKTFRHDAARILPDRAAVGMTQPFMAAYTRRVVQTCHRRGVHAMGGMAAQIPIRGDEAANAAALARVEADKEREARGGHDGTWVAHPGLVPVARRAFARHVDGPNQLDVMPEGTVSAADLVAPPTGPRTEAGLRHNVRVGVQYLEAWLGGQGCVPLYHLMEDAATAEISRAQVWQQVRHRAKLDDGSEVNALRVERVIDEELGAIEAEVGAARFATGRYPDAAGLFAALVTADEMVEFLTLPAYEYLLAEPARKDNG
ncbi:MAG: malate synthase A [Myxococcales bacterium]|nr:malate synthase A [Myxococcales bacterium]